MATTPGCSARWPAPWRFRRRDHMGDESVPLAEAVRRRVLEATGTLPDGPIRLLTGLGFFWQRFNPVSFYYCFDRAGELLQFVVAEVTNTPWGEQYSYVLDARQQMTGPAAAGASSPPLRFVTEKRFHVSPFLPMDLVYHWRLSPPTGRLLVDISETQGDDRIFRAGMALERQPFTARALAANFLRVPAVTLKITAGIYWQALRLWLKSIPFFPHPANK